MMKSNLILVATGTCLVSAQKALKDAGIDEKDVTIVSTFGEARIALESTQEQTESKVTQFKLKPLPDLTNATITVDHKRSYKPYRSKLNKGR